MLLLRNRKEWVLWIMVACALMIFGAAGDRWVNHWLTRPVAPAYLPACETVETTYL